MDLSFVMWTSTHYINVIERWCLNQGISFNLASFCAILFLLTVCYVGNLHISNDWWDFRCLPSHEEISVSRHIRSQYHIPHIGYTSDMSGRLALLYFRDIMLIWTKPYKHYHFQSDALPSVTVGRHFQRWQQIQNFMPDAVSQTV